ncbi:cytochrome P450 [Jidongwangia harbinensis]|uniref:cytochrome P450 n=1 Tax=Jidongwangia harbinensis TaxID=2878561 RepID=UPI001CD966B8|nr:cytochrome P450 [Jidongwangia harbinensis]MCA2211340.1 cytochrome P450 [Jidongwangia harbinensis]
MSALTDTVAYGIALHRRRARLAVHALARRDPMAQLEVWPGRFDPYPRYDRIRATGPMVRTRTGAWVTTSHALCDEMLRDRRYGVQARDEPPADSPTELSFLDRDPPDHGRLRRLVAPAFTPRRIAQFRPRVEDITARLVESAAGHRSFDLIAAVAVPLPIAVISDLLGLSGADRAALVRYGRTIGDGLDGARSLGQARRLRLARAALDRTFAELIVRRRRAPGDDLVSRLLAAEGEQLSPAELRALCTLLLVAGFDTTVNLLGNAVHALLSHPDQWAMLRADPALAARAVEETLRYDAPVQRVARVTHEAVELGGVPLRPGEWVFALLGAANRDPAAYAHPDRFDLTRPPAAEHLAFSAGPHFCLGAALARLEGEVALEVLARRLDLRPGGSGRRRRSATMRGFRRLPVVARPARDR